MIKFLSYKTPKNKKITEQVLKLISDTFGIEEEILERRQLFGDEKDKNIDYLFTALEDKKLIGTLHLTITKSNHSFGCLGGMVIAPEARGKGIASILFNNACSYFDKLGGKCLFLGTSNPIALKLYEKYGFRFLSGTSIMVRTTENAYFDFLKNIYTNQNYKIVKIDDSSRIPIIPLIASRCRDILMDSNCNIVNSLYATQNSCTGLYPRFLNLSNFGNSYVAKLDNQGIIAILTEKIINNTHNIDCFSYKGYENILHELLKQTLENNVKYSAIIAKEDYDKQKLFESFNFKIIKEYDFNFNKIHIPCYYYELNK